MTDTLPSIAVLGASGLIGSALAEMLAAEAFRVVPIARRLSGAQRAAFGSGATEVAIAELDAASLSDLLARYRVNVVVNCLGVLQDGPRGRTQEVHELFVARLLDALARQPTPVLLIHVSIPGRANQDSTPFSRTKRAGERRIATSGLPYVVLRPGFVIAPAAYGGSALIRACAALPFRLPAAVAQRPLAPVAMRDIGRTVATVAQRWHGGERAWAATWDLSALQGATAGAVIEAFRARFGGPPVHGALPNWLMSAGALAGDVAGWLGWSPPVRTTALAELRRGVETEPHRWAAESGVSPSSLDDALRAVPATVQERWFARLFLLKPLLLAALALFWIATGLVALTVGFRQAAAILVAHGIPPGLAEAATVVTSLADLAIGALIARRRTARAGLAAGTVLSLGYLAGATLLAPDLWLDPLGPFPKIVPVIMAMVVASAILDDR